MLEIGRAGQRYYIFEVVGHGYDGDRLVEYMHRDFSMHGSCGEENFYHSLTEAEKALDIKNNGGGYFSSEDFEL
jgi:hypothetical protein